jgi:hypothetical protein
MRHEGYCSILLRFAYIKSWLQKLKEDAQFIKTILLDVKRASAMITKAIEECSEQAAKAA